MEDRDQREFALEVEDYSFTYASSDVKALDGITFSLRKGSFAALCGVSGSGKSTLLRAFKPELAVAGEASGTIRVLGDDPYELSPVESATRVGFVMQDPENSLPLIQYLFLPNLHFQVQTLLRQQGVYI